MSDHSGSGSDDLSGASGNEGGGVDIFAAFRNQCVTVDFTQGPNVTGFFVAAFDGLLLLTVAGQPELVSLFTARTVKLAGPNAC
jgi:hypothetical protein